MTVHGGDTTQRVIPHRRAGDCRSSRRNGHAKGGWTGKHRPDRRPRRRGAPATDGGRSRADPRLNRRDAVLHGVHDRSRSIGPVTSVTASPRTIPSSTYSGWLYGGDGRRPAARGGWRGRRRSSCAPGRSARGAGRGNWRTACHFGGADRRYVPRDHGPPGLTVIGAAMGAVPGKAVPASPVFRPRDRRRVGSWWPWAMIETVPIK